MKQTSNFGYKFLLFLFAIIAIAHAGARGFRYPFDYDPNPMPDTPSVAKDSPKLIFPIYDKTGDPIMDQNPSTIDLKDPSNIHKTFEYDPVENRYFITEKIGDQFYRNPTYLTLEEYLKYQAKEDEDNYWKRRLDALTLFNKKPALPTMYKEGIFDRIFGGDKIQVRPQGNVDVTLGGNWQNIKNPTLVQRAQKYGVFDFDLQMNINLLATIGDKMKLNISNNTKATFDYQNVQKLEYTGKEDEIIKKIEAGNVSFPLKSTLITGVQSLFGIKTQLQFGKLWVTAAVSQQKSKRQSLTIQGGSQTQNFSITADQYEENRHFLLAQYFHDNYNNVVKNFPVINSLINITKIEVWVTNRTGAVTGVRDVIGFMDLGEKTPYNSILAGGSVTSVPDNRSNQLYNKLLQNPNGRLQSNATNAVLSLGLQQSVDFERVTARQLNASEFSFNPQLGYLSLNTTLNPDDVLGVAYQYNYNGKTYKVGEFAEDLPPDTTNTKVLYLKLLKGTSSQPLLPIWQLMMKNIYALGSIGVSKDNFRLDVLYQNPSGGNIRYLPEGPSKGIPLLTLLNLDRLNSQNNPQPDGVFDFVDGVTINTQQGKIIFPVLEPFGRDLQPALGGNVQLERKYLYDVLYDSTKTVAQQFQQQNRYVIKGSFKSASSSEIFLGGFNIPQGSVTVSAGGQLLVENQDYQIDYGLGRLKIINAGILNSGIPINVQYEDNATFGFQQQNFMGARLDYYLNKKFSIGSTLMRLTERPFSQKTTYGEDPIRNTVLGLDANYQSEFPGLTRALDKLPIYSTTSSSFITASGEVAGLKPGHPKQINSLDPQGAVYIDDFEGTNSGIDLRLPAQSWSLASTPAGALDANGSELFPEAKLDNNLDYGKNRARLAWYTIEPTLIDGAGGVPDYVKKDPDQHYIRLVQQQDVFPAKNTATLQNALTTFDLGYYPRERGPYNYDDNINSDGTLPNPSKRWGGIMRPIDNSDFEQANVEFIEFWVMDPFINKQSSTGGSLYIDLGNVSEDVLKDSRKFFENGIPYPPNPSQLSPTVWGVVPTMQTQIVRAFDNDPAARAVQDVGYDGLNDDDEKVKFAPYLSSLSNIAPGVLAQIQSDPSNDDYRYYRDASYDASGAGILARYKKYNNPQGNSPITDNTQAFSTAATNIPESEDINRDNTLNESEDYYQYRIDLNPKKMAVGSNYIVNTVTSAVKLPNGNTENETWYQYKIPIHDFGQKVGNIADFRSIRFIRLFLTGFQDSTLLRFAALDLGRNQWRSYQYSLQSPGENIPAQDQATTDFSVSAVSVEENSDRTPIPYVIPPGVNRQLANTSNNQSIQLNEQALSLKVCALSDGDARGVYKNVGVDMRQFGRLRMFMHAESQVNQTPIKDGDVYGFIRVGSDFTNNYYEYQIPLKITAPGSKLAEEIWPVENNLDVALDDLVKVKTDRNNKGIATYIPYSERDSKGNNIIIVGNPNVGDAKTIMLGILNPKKSNSNTGDDGLPKCTEVWFNELRMTGLNEKPSYAASGKVNLQMADLGTVKLGGSMHSEGYGSIDQKVNQRSLDNFYQYDASTNLSLGKLLPKNWGVQLPLYVGYSQTVSNPKYDPYNLDVKLSDELSNAQSKAERDSIKNVAQDFTSITSFNLSNVRILGDPKKQSKKAKPWSLKNFDLSYSYNKQFKRNPLIQSDALTNQKLGIGYSYNVKSKPLEPFKSLIKSRSKWVSLIKDFNINPLPSNFTFRTDLNRIFEQTQVRSVGDVLYQIQPTYFKNFLWKRDYTLRWELTKSLGFDYHASNQSNVDEPYGKIDSKVKRDSLWNSVKSFGRNTFFSQAFNSSYNVPFSKLPITDWISTRASYGSTYNWTVASQLARGLGNTVANTQNIQLNGELNFANLYNKSRWLKAINSPKPLGSNAPNDKNQKGVSRSQKDVNNNNFMKNGGGRDGKGGGASDVETAGDAGNGQDAGANGEPIDPSKQTHMSDADVAKSQKDTSWYTNIVRTNFTDPQLDSMKDVFQAQQHAKWLAEKAKRKKDRIARRKSRRNSVPEVSDAVRIIGRLLTMVKRTTVNYQQQSGTILPGYMDSTRFLGINSSTGQPGFNYVFGYQPGKDWLQTKAADGKLTTDSLFNSQFQQQFSQNLTILTTVEPLPNLRIDLNWQKSFSKTHSELYKDTGTGTFNHLSPYETGSFNVTFIGIKTIFGSSETNFQNFLTNRVTISKRLGANNPYTNSTADPNDPAFTKGYTGFSQDVLLPAFIAAYSGRSAQSVALVDYSNDNSIKGNPFKYFFPLPNWKLSYNGLTKIPFFSNFLTNFVITHAYSGTMAMNSFVTAQYYQDLFGVGFPSFIDSTSGNYVPFFQVPNVTISEQFNPLFGFDASFKNKMTARFQYIKSRTVSLSLIDYQVSETKSTEYVFGFGYRIKGLVLPFSVFGVKKLKNDLNVKMDIGLRDDKTSNNYLGQNVDITTRGQKVLSISPSIDYIVSEKLTLRLFYDRRQTIPYVSSSFPITTTKAGITLRFLFAQ